MAKFFVWHEVFQKGRERSLAIGRGDFWDELTGLLTRNLPALSSQIKSLSSTELRLTVVKTWERFPFCQNFWFEIEENFRDIWKAFFPSRGRAAFSVTNLQPHCAESQLNENGSGTFSGKSVDPGIGISTLVFFTSRL